MVTDGRSSLLVAEQTPWLESLGARGQSPKTVAVYRNGLDSLNAHVSADVRAADVTEGDLLAWRRSLVSRKLAAGTVDVYLRAARTWFSWMEERGALFLNPAAGLVLPKVARRLLPVPSPTEIKRWLGAPNPATPFGVRDRALLELAYATAARREELQSLDVTALDLMNATVRVVGKGRKERVLPLTKPAVLWLTRYTAMARPRLLKGRLDELALWIDNRGKRLTYMALEHAFDRHAAMAGLDGVSPHTMRRACATHLLQRGAHVVFVQQLLGHATMRHLAHYLRMSILELKQTHRASKPGQ